MNTQNETIQKPIPLRIIFILNGLMMFLPFIFFIIFKTKDIHIDGFDPILMIYTGISYIVSFAFLVYMILSKKIIGIRIVIGVNILIAIPAKAYIGILVAIVSLILSFHNKVQSYFKQ